MKKIFETKEQIIEEAKKQIDKDIFGVYPSKVTILFSPVNSDKCVSLEKQVFEFNYKKKTWECRIETDINESEDLPLKVVTLYIWIKSENNILFSTRPAMEEFYKIFITLMFAAHEEGFYSKTFMKLKKKIIKYFKHCFPEICENKKVKLKYSFENLAVEENKKNAFYFNVTDNETIMNLFKEDIMKLLKEKHQQLI
jgi:hypothetical protein|nr:MAG TPA: hypothetical protein [Caudoviricetes sp.]